MISVIFKHNNSKRSYVVNEGFTILEVARKYNIQIEGACEGSLACSTCHVLLDEKWFNKLDPANEEEKEMLGLLPDLKKHSRLGCQINVNEKFRWNRNNFTKKMNKYFVETSEDCFKNIERLSV